VAVLLRLFVVGVLAAGIAKLRELKTSGCRLLVLRCRVVPVLARRTLQCNDFAHLFILTDFGDLFPGILSLAYFQSLRAEAAGVNQTPAASRKAT
jgi:hypothetical protein